MSPSTSQPHQTVDLPPGVRVGGHPEPDGDQPMSDAEFRMVRESVGLGQDELAQWLAVDVRTVRRWENGDRRVPKAVRDELEAMEEEHAQWVERLVALLGDAGDVVLTIPREAPVPRVAGWWRSIAYEVARSVPELYIRYDT